MLFCSAQRYGINAVWGNHKSDRLLESDYQNTCAFINEIEKNIDKARNSGYWPRRINYNFVAIVEYSLKHYKTSAEEFKSISEEIQDEVLDNHAVRLRRIAEVADKINQDIGRIWNSEYHDKEYEDPDFRAVERIYADSRGMAVNLLDCSNVASRLTDFIGKKQAPKSKFKPSGEFNIYNRWWLASLMVLIVTFIVSYLTIENVKYSIILGLIASIFVFFRNPKRRFNTAFWSVLGVLISTNYLSINLMVNYLEKTETSNLDFRFSIQEPSVLFSILLVILLIVLAVLDYKEGRS